jgi:hypothetical protein
VLSLLRTMLLRKAVRERWEQAARYHGAGADRRLFPVVEPEIARLLSEGRVEATLDELVRAPLLCAEIRRG